MVPVQVADKYRVHLRRAEAKLGKLPCRPVTDVDQNVLATRDQQVGRLRTRGTGYRTGNRPQRHPATSIDRHCGCVRCGIDLLSMERCAGKRQGACQCSCEFKHSSLSDQKSIFARTPYVRGGLCSP
jgi:hypothetical protein